MFVNVRDKVLFIMPLESGLYLVKSFIKTSHLCLCLHFRCGVPAYTLTYPDPTTFKRNTVCEWIQSTSKTNMIFPYKRHQHTRYRLQWSPCKIKDSHLGKSSRVICPADIIGILYTNITPFCDPVDGSDSENVLTNVKTSYSKRNIAQKIIYLNLCLDLIIF